MNAEADFADSWARFEKGFQDGRLAHAYLVIGAPRGPGAAFALAALRLLFGARKDDEPLARRLAQRVHPDVVWIEPQSKSRVIRVDEMRVLNARIQQTAMEGEWKVGILVGADRLNEQASNAFLKTLEEPSGQTLLLLLTDAPHALLPTIRSRCQQIVLSRRGEGLTGEWREALLAACRAHPGHDPWDMLQLSESLRGLLDEIKAAIESQMEQREDEDKPRFDARVQARLLEVRRLLLQVLMEWQRDVLYMVLNSETDLYLHFPEEHDALREQAARVTVEQALKRITAVEDLARRLDRNVPPTMAFDAGFGAFIPRRRKTD